MSRTYHDIASALDPRITAEETDFILWNMTAFPFSDVRYTVYQMRRAIRLRGRDVCPYCLMDSAHCKCRRGA